LALLPDILLVGVAAVCALLPLVRPGERLDLYRWIAVIGLLGTVAASGFVLHAMRLNQNGIAITVWNGGLVVDHFSIYITVAACAFSLITCLVSDTYIRRIPSRAGGFYALMLLITAGVSALAAQREMITFFVALEVVSIGLTALHALMKPDELAAEGAWKHFVEGAVATAAVLYGLAILYGVTGSTDLSAVSGALHRAAAPATLGLVLVLLGLTFLLGIFPLREWVSRAADVTPAAVTGFLVTMGVTAGAVGWLRFGVSGLGAGVGPWTGLTAVLAAIGLLYAALVAVRETRVPRLLGQVASAQAALLLLGILSFGTGATHSLALGTTAFLFALGIFGVSVLTAFGVVAILQTARLPDTLAGYRGLAHRSPRAALLLIVSLAALIGAPPLAGFLARLFVLEAAVDAGYGWVVVVALAAIVIVAVPVVRLGAAMYAETGEETPFTMGATPLLSRIVTTGCCVAAFLATVLAQPLLMLARGGAGPIP
jgi:NADH-quinone oxidoreductase subunit N